MLLLNADVLYMAADGYASDWARGHEALDWQTTAGLNQGCAVPCNMDLSCCVRTDAPMCHRLCAERVQMLACPCKNCRIASLQNRLHADELALRFAIKLI